MSLKNTFCASPWLHMRITNSGEYRPCRWSYENSGKNISDQTPIEFFQKGLSPLRTAMLNGDSIQTCDQCHEMERYGKVSGRQRQLLKVGVDLNAFEKSLRSSTFFDEFSHSVNHDGDTDLYPVDWQIDLGNHCNSACVFCRPKSSSRLAAEFKKIGLIAELPPKSWTEDQRLLQRFVDTLENSPDLAYLHFIGGETLITPAFRIILERLIDRGLTSCAIGFTTNLTVWDQQIVDLLRKFDTVNVGLSIETMDSVNDYVRWPSKIEVVLETLDRWIQVSRLQDWYISLRITPTLLTVSRLVDVYDFAYHSGLAVESCNFLQSPEFLKPGVLPAEYRAPIINRLETWIAQHISATTTAAVVNVRDPNQVHSQIVQDAQSYVSYLKTVPDESSFLSGTVEYLKRLEQSRSNSVLEYLPEYENLFRSAGY